MNHLEKKIKENALNVQQKLSGKNVFISKSLVITKAGFSDGWNQGWGNYGKTFKPVEIKY